MTHTQAVHLSYMGFGHLSCQSCGKRLACWVLRVERYKSAGEKQEERVEQVHDVCEVLPVVRRRSPGPPREVDPRGPRHVTREQAVRVLLEERIQVTELRVERLMESHLHCCYSTPADREKFLDELPGEGERE